jgi:4-hydroxybenzoate polyprenyltransferase
MARVIGILKLAHPFPSLLNSLATVAIATLAGAGPLVAGRLGLSMLGMQVAIGALNDLVDTDRDAVVKPGKPIPSGRASPGHAKVLTVIGGSTMVVLSAPSGPATVIVAALGLGLGFLYDLWLSRTLFSWLPLALALPLVPMLAWQGSTGAIPAGLLLLVIVAVPAGFLLALANGLVDVERDRASGKVGVVVAMGARQAWLLNAVVTAVVVVLAVLLIPAIPSGGYGAHVAPGDWASRAGIQRVGLLAGIGLLAIGIAALRAATAAIRERGWELQAVGVLAVGVAWIAGLPPAS